MVLVNAPTPKSYVFGVKAFRRRPELIPLVVFLGGAGAMAACYSGYALYQKSDVTIKKNTPEATWERVNPEQPQKLLTFNQKYKRIDELEKLRKEIGSYKA